MANTNPTEPGTARHVHVHVDGKVIDATLHDNPAARSLIDQLPLSVPFTDYAGQEKVGPLPKPVTTTGMPSGDHAEPLDLGYYAPGGVLVLYYTDVPYHRGISRLGYLHATVDDLRHISEGALATIQIAPNPPS